MIMYSILLIQMLWLCLHTYSCMIWPTISGLPRSYLGWPSQIMSSHIACQSSFHIHKRHFKYNIFNFCLYPNAVLISCLSVIHPTSVFFNPFLVFSELTLRGGGRQHRFHLLRCHGHHSLVERAADGLRDPWVPGTGPFEKLSTKGSLRVLAGRVGAVTRPSPLNTLFAIRNLPLFR